MNDLIVKTTAMALKILSEYVSEGDIVVDATAGNGNDTLALAKLVKKTGKVYSFDVQDEALKTTKALLEREGYGDICYLIKDSHHHMQDYILEKGKISAVVFNLGYLPKGEKNITTKKETSLDAVKQALNLIKQRGLVLITMYSGHEEGKREKDALLDYASQLSSKEYHAAYFNLINQPNNPPELLMITKK